MKGLNSPWPCIVIDLEGPDGRCSKEAVDPPPAAISRGVATGICGTAPKQDTNGWGAEKLKARDSNVKSTDSTRC